MPKKIKRAPKGLYGKFLIVFNLSIIISTIIILAGLIITGYEIYGEEFLLKKAGIINAIIKFAPVLGTFALSLIVISTANVFWFKKQIIYPVSVLEETAEAIRKGDFDRRITLKTGDEFEKLADVFNHIMTALSTSIQTEQERKEMQSNIIKFLQIMTSASEGDLTKKAEVNPDIFGSLSDAFNLMTESLSELVKEAKKSANEIENKSLTLNEITQKLREGTNIQKKETTRISSLIEESSNIATQTSEKTKIATEVSKEAIDATLKGDEIVTETMHSIELIRTAAQSINRRMKLLSEKLMEIGTITTIISDIANRTNLLALNASIEASRAGEEGKGFIVIAEEIRGLSERTTKSSKNINEIISTIQEEATAVTKHLEEQTSYVGLGSDMINKTIEIFEKIDSIIKNISQIIFEINEFAIKQKEITFNEVSSAQKVRETTEDIFKITEETTQISEALSNTSKELINITGRFKI